MYSQTVVYEGLNLCLNVGMVTTKFIKTPASVWCILHNTLVTGKQGKYGVNGKTCFIVTLCIISWWLIQFNNI